MCRVPHLASSASAEHAIALMTSANRRLLQAYTRSQGNNFHLNGLLGFDMVGRGACFLGTGNSGSVAAHTRSAAAMATVSLTTPSPTPRRLTLSQRDWASSTCRLTS